MVLSEDDERFYRSVNPELEQLNAAAPQDYYQLLGIDLDVPAEDVKAAFRRLQRIVHPDICGPSATAVAVLLNSAYATLMDDEARKHYNAELLTFRQDAGEFDGRPVSQWTGEAHEQRAMFVDEGTCIGCRQCTFIAPNTFFMEEDWGRARVAQQWGDEEGAVKEAMDLCPVTCIYFVPRRQLALLEFSMKRCKREQSSTMARRRSGNMGMAPASENPFVKAETFLKNRKIAQIVEGAHRDGRVATGGRGQDDMLAAAIARAWLDLPPAARANGWPEWKGAGTTP